MEYKLKTCYLNCAEHLLNSQNANIMYENAPGKWSDDEWSDFFDEIKGFGYNNFQIWIPPTLCVEGEARDGAVKNINRISEICHSAGLMFNPLMTVNTFGGQWYFACPNVTAERHRITDLWEFYAKNLVNADIMTILPGDPGGCNRNGCTHVTFIELAAEIADRIKALRPDIIVEVGTWGTPFSGWGDDMRKVKNWDGTFAALTDPENCTPEIPCHIWNGSPERAVQAMEDLVKRLPAFPTDTMFSVSSGFNPDCEPDGAYDGRKWANIISQTHKVTSWDYSASEGELICYPHWRVAKFARKRRTEMQSTPYYGAICYTMTPKLNLLMLYSAAQIMKNPFANPDKIASEFSYLVFGDEKIGLLAEAFEIVNGWGFEPRKNLTRNEAREMLCELVCRLNESTSRKPQIKVFPSVSEYRDELIWHAHNFIEMLGDNPDREAIKNSYKAKLLSIYNNIPSAVDERTVLASDGYSKIGLNLKW